MEYQRQFDEIQAGFALNAAKLLWQYEALTKRTSFLPADNEDQYEGTLTLCVLQALLSQCTELLSFLEHQELTRDFFDHKIGREPHPWGLREEFVTADSLPAPLTLKRLLTHMRNAVSHPSFGSPNSAAPPTGFTTAGSTPGAPIVAYRFTDSYWVKAGMRHFRGSLPQRIESDVRGRARQFDKEWGVKDYLSVVATTDGSFDLVRNGEIYWPIFQIELPLFELRKLATELANYLAHKTLRDWDGCTIRRFVPLRAASCRLIGTAFQKDKSAHPPRTWSTAAKVGTAL